MSGTVSILNGGLTFDIDPKVVDRLRESKKTFDDWCREQGVAEGKKAAEQFFSFEQMRNLMMKVMSDVDIFGREALSDFFELTPDELFRTYDLNMPTEYYHGFVAGISTVYHSFVETEIQANWDLDNKTRYFESVNSIMLRNPLSIKPGLSL